MRFELRRGRQPLNVEIPDSTLRGSFRGSTHRLEQELEAKVRAILDEPLDAPALSTGVVPDDVIVIVLDADLPEVARVLTPILHYLRDLGLEPSKMKVLGSSRRLRWSDQLAEELPDEFNDVHLIEHNPEDEKQHAYLASTQDGRRIYLNREVVDADSLIVVGRTGFDPVVGTRGTASHLYPALGNRQAQTRSRQLAAQLTPLVEEMRQRQACDEVAWLSGLFYSLGVAVNRDNQIEQMWFGHYASVQRAADEYTKSRWTFERPASHPDLIVATVSADDRRASWESVASAVEVAAEIAGPDSKVVVITDLDEPPGPAGRYLMENDNPWNSVAQLREARVGDPLPMTRCAKALTVTRVHLYCHLEPSLLEQMSIVPITSDRELQNLIDRADSCFVIEDADRVHVR